MNSLTTDSEAALRLAVFFGVFLVLALAELIVPRRRLTVSKPRRWFTNLSISILNTILIRLLIPMTGVAAALVAQEQNWGLLNMLALPAWLSILLFLLLFDLAIYFQHRVFHLVPWLWRLHRMHHTDLDYDVTTGNRFHPLSILISSVIKLTLVVVLGPLPVAIVLAEVILNATSMFNHSNIALPARLDGVLRKFVVTPDMHRVHHSVNTAEHNRNYGFNFPWWDHLFGSYLARAELGHTEMHIGIEGFQTEDSARISHLLMQPFRKGGGEGSA